MRVGKNADGWWLAIAAALLKVAVGAGSRALGGAPDECRASSRMPAHVPIVKKAPGDLLHRRSEPNGAPRTVLDDFSHSVH